MKHLLILSFALFLSNIISAQQQQLPNAGMESWSMGAFTETPDSFICMGSFPFPSNSSVEKTSQSHSGQYAALLEDKGNTGLLAYGTLVYDSVNYWWLWEKKPFHSRPVTLRFWFKFNKLGNDTAIAYVHFTKWTTYTSLVAMGAINIVSSVNSYTEAVVNLEYFSSLPPDSIYLSFQTSTDLNFGTLGTQLFIDDISFDYGPNIVSDISGSPFSLYPNPCTDRLIITSKELHKFDLSIADVMGRLLYTASVPGNQLELDVSSFSKGMYFIRLNGLDREFSMKFLKN